MKKLLLIVVASAIAAPVAGLAQAPAAGTAAAAAATATAAAKAEQEVLKAEKDRFEAMVKADTGALDKLLAPELSYTHSNAQLQDKAGIDGDIRNKSIRYLSIEPSDIHAVVLGTTAVVTGSAVVKVIQNGDDVNIKIRYTTVHINRRGEWQMVAWQATRVPQ
jgi:hypothetical protein